MSMWRLILWLASSKDSLASEMISIDQVSFTAALTSQVAATSPAPGLLGEVCERIMDELKSKIQKVEASNDAAAIQYSSLDFPTGIESNAYLAQ